MKEPLLSIQEEKFMQRFVGFFKRHHEFVKEIVIIDTYYENKNFYYFFEDLLFNITFNDRFKKARVVFIKDSHIEDYDNAPCVIFSDENAKTKFIIIENQSDNTPKPIRS